MAGFTGGCLCGKVRYASTAPTMEIFCGSAQAWTSGDGATRQRFAKGPA